MSPDSESHTEPEMMPEGSQGIRRSKRGWITAAGLSGLLLLSFLSSLFLLPSTETPENLVRPHYNLFRIESASANHRTDTMVEAVQIWICDTCHAVGVTLTNGVGRQVSGIALTPANPNPCNVDGATDIPGTSVTGAGDIGANNNACQVVIQGGDWGPAVAGMFNGKHANQSFTDALGHDANVYVNYFNNCYGPGTTFDQVTGALGSPCRSGGGIWFDTMYRVESTGATQMPPIPPPLG